MFRCCRSHSRHSSPLHRGRNPEPCLVHSTFRRHKLRLRRLRNSPKLPHTLTPPGERSTCHRCTSRPDRSSPHQQNRNPLPLSERSIFRPHRSPPRMSGNSHCPQDSCSLYRPVQCSMCRRCKWRLHRSSPPHRGRSPAPGSGHSISPPRRAPPTHSLRSSGSGPCSPSQQGASSRCRQSMLRPRRSSLSLRNNRRRADRSIALKRNRCRPLAGGHHRSYRNRAPRPHSRHWAYSRPDNRGGAAES